ncbi:hypothetical protein Glove_203g58 [Diversispora epigaea]|uniref:Protein kinase domain-containing protein n=1 Tax=Diversispora epigaea TaxID=1348612 RepID=A0A397IQT1_9GLOM|nr:hypothetical protein Glove_203g58 [Diversispora epigaea]
MPPECNQEHTDYFPWCQSCNSHFRNNFDKWTKWVLYDKLKYIKQIAKGGFGTIRLASSINKEFLNEMSILWNYTRSRNAQKYMMVLSYAKDGNLRDYLKNNFNNINWEANLYYLRRLAINFKSIQDLDIVHQDFHPGNILSNNFMNFLLGGLYITDFGLTSEVLSDEEYTKAADVYSFGIITYEIITGIPPYYDIPHNKDLVMKICNGFRPKIPFHIPKLITRIIMRCWDARVTHRPTFEELIIRKIRILKMEFKLKKAEEFSLSTNTITTTNPLDYKTHPQAIYTSRFLNFSSLPKPKNDEN